LAVWKAELRGDGVRETRSHCGQEAGAAQALVFSQLQDARGKVGVGVAIQGEMT
jgi:hypothetical protein